MACVSALSKTGIPVGTPVTDKVGDLIVEDYNIRNYLKKTLYSAGVPTIEIERDIATRYASISTAPDPASLSARAAQRSSASACPSKR